MTSGLPREARKLRAQREVYELQTEMRSLTIRAHLLSDAVSARDKEEYAKLIRRFNAVAQDLEAFRDQNRELLSE